MPVGDFHHHTLYNIQLYNVWFKSPKNRMANGKFVPAQENKPIAIVFLFYFLFLCMTNLPRRQWWPNSTFHSMPQCKHWDKKAKTWAAKRQLIHSRHNTNNMTQLIPQNSNQQNTDSWSNQADIRSWELHVNGWWHFWQFVSLICSG